MGFASKQFEKLWRGFGGSFRVRGGAEALTGWWGLRTESAGPSDEGVRGCEQSKENIWKGSVLWEDWRMHFFWIDG